MHSVGNFHYLPDFCLVTVALSASTASFTDETNMVLCRSHRKNPSRWRVQHISPKHYPQQTPEEPQFYSSHLTNVILGLIRQRTVVSHQYWHMKIPTNHSKLSVLLWVSIFSPRNQRSEALKR